MPDHPLDNVDRWRGSTASQTGGLTLAAARAIIASVQDKAFTALVNRMPTRDLAAIVQPGTEFYGCDSVAGGRTIVFAGGMPLERDGVLVGAIGVSGGDAAQHQRAADAGVGAFDAP